MVFIQFSNIYTKIKSKIYSVHTIAKISLVINVDDDDLSRVCLRMHALLEMGVESSNSVGTFITYG